MKSVHEKVVDILIDNLDSCHFCAIHDIECMAFCHRGEVNFDLKTADCNDGIKQALINKVEEKEDDR
jgi:hypothetical protein